MEGLQASIPHPQIILPKSKLHQTHNASSAVPSATITDWELEDHPFSKPSPPDSEIMCCGTAAHLDKKGTVLFTVGSNAHHQVHLLL
jgi:hypothetical protein